MIDHIFSLICLGSSIDTETNSLSVYNILEQLTFQFNGQPPEVIPITIEVISDWVRRDRTVPSIAKMRVFFCDLNNICKQQAELDINLTEAIFFRTRLRASGMEYRGPGLYKFTVQILQDGASQWQEVASIPLLIQVDKTLDLGIQSN